MSQRGTNALAQTGPVTTVSHADLWHGLKIGVASYTLRKIPLDLAIKDIQRVGLKYVSIKDSHLAMKSTAEERKAVAQKFKDAGITPVSCGNVSMKNEEADIRAAFEYARDIGLPTIVCAPNPDSMPLLDKMVKEFDIKLAIHNHGPEDKRFPAPTDVWNAVQPYDKRIGLCIDVGHAARAGDDPAEAVLKYRDRLYDMHLKDISNITPKGANVEVGPGRPEHQIYFAGDAENPVCVLRQLRVRKRRGRPAPRSGRKRRLHAGPAGGNRLRVEG